MLYMYIINKEYIVLVIKNIHIIFLHLLNYECLGFLQEIF